jgi:autotransporter-associated beta strand protein
MIATKTTKDSNRSFEADSSSNRRAKRFDDPALSNRAFAIFFIVTILIALALLLAPKAGAANRNWNGGTDSAWSTNTNWSGPGGGTVPVSGDTATFSGAGNGHTTISLGSVTVKLIIFDTASAAAYTLGASVGAGTFTLNDAGGVSVTSTVVNNETINSNILLGDVNATSQTFTFTNDSTTSNQLLTIAGGISSATTGTKALTVNGAGNTLISGNITNGTATISLTKGGTGQLTVTGSNSYTGATTISANGGTLKIDNNNTTTARLASTSGITVNSGGTLLLSQTGVASTNRINDSATMTLSGGTFNTGGLSERGGTLAAPTAGIGALTLTATSTINFGSGNTSIIEFSGLGTHTAGTILQITNWDGIAGTGGGTERLLFAGTASSFTSLYTQSDVSFNGVAGYFTDQFSGFYEVTAVPEPSTWIAGFLTVGVIGYSQLRKRSRAGRRRLCSRKLSEFAGLRKCRSSIRIL